MAQKASQIGEFGEILNFNRRTARDLAFKYIFQWNVIGEDVIQNMEELYNMDFKPVDSGYIREVVNGVIKYCDEFDNLISANSKGWKKGRISNVCMAVMRLALYEILYMKEIPRSVSINEAIELIKTYDSPEAAAFVNGILGNIGEEKPETNDKKD